MAQFEIPDWAMPQAAPEPAPPPDPAMTREQQIADNTRAEQALNGFIAAKQAALFEAPDAFYRTEGADAIHAAPTILDTLSRLRDDSLDGLDNNVQRDRLGRALDAHLELARDDVARHVAEQSLTWQRLVAQDRIALLTKEAAFHHNDDDLVDAIGTAASNAARAHARIGDSPLDSQAEDAAAATARSSALGAAIQARIGSGATAEATNLYDRVRDRLVDDHALSLGEQIRTLQRFNDTQANAPQFASPAPNEVEQSVIPVALGEDTSTDADTTTPGMDGEKLAQVEISPHALGRMQQKGISADHLMDAINSSNKVLQSNGNTKCIGPAVIVILNPAGRVVTCYWK